MNSKNKKLLRVMGKVLFICYIIFLIYFLLFSDWYGRDVSGTQEYRCNLELFREIRRFWNYREQLGMFVFMTNLFGNVLIFVPFGFFLPMASRYRSLLGTLFYSFGLSFGVEIFQLITKVGSLDVDDMLLNTIGGIVGYLLFLICNGVRRRWIANENRKRKR